MATGLSVAGVLSKPWLEPIRFVLVGCVNTLVGLGVIYGAKFFFGAGEVAANALGYGVGLTVSFTLNAKWTFGYNGPYLRAAAKFLAAFAISYACNLATVLALIDGLGVNSYIAQALGIPPYTACFYLLSRFAVFRRR